MGSANKYVLISRKITNPIMKDGKQWYEHRWVWTQAHGKIPKGMQVHHINGKKNDNRLENLTLVTSKENMEKPDMLGKGWYFRKDCPYRPYLAIRVINGKRFAFGNWATICGAVMASRMAFITK